MSDQIASYNPRKINRRVPAGQYDAAIVHGGDYLADLGTPPAANVSGLVTAQSATAVAAVTFTLATDELSHRYGANIRYDGPTTATGDRNLQVKGRDYLGQPMREDINLAATAVSGQKAFKWIDSIVHTSGTAGATNISIGWGDILGLPFRCLGPIHDGTFIDEASVTNGSVVNGMATTVTAGATTADVRGTFVHSGTAPNGSRRFRLHYIASRSEMHGAAQYYA